MFLAEPPETTYDLRFHLFGFPIRVHPYFWLAALILGANGSFGSERGFDQEAGMKLLMWILAMFVSILFHELGHAFAFRHFGHAARVVLYMFGGLATVDRSSNPWAQPARIDNRANILISVSGPGAGFLLAAAVAGMVMASGGSFQFQEGLPFWFCQLPAGTGPTVWYLVQYMLWINIFWGLINLLPVFPLDGGQIANSLLCMNDPMRGSFRALQVSLITALILAVGGYVVMHSIFMALMFGSLAYSNYMTMKQMGSGYGGGPW